MNATSQNLFDDPVRGLRDLAEFLPLRALGAAIQCVDPEQNLRTAAAFGSLYAKIASKRTARAKSNILRSMPDTTETEAERLAVESIRYMFRLFLVDSLAMPRLVNPWSWQEHVEFSSFAQGAELLASEKPALFITGHCGNWEILGFTLAAMGFPMTALARPLDNPYLDRWLLGLREARGLRVLTKWGATDRLISMIEGDDPAGRRVGFIADQNAGESGLFVPFLGRLASSYKSIGLLAMRYELPVVAGFARRIGNRFQYRLEMMDYFGPEDWCDQPDPLYYVTARFNRAIEKMVLSAPDQYLWIHRRWKSRPKWELQGKEMPASMRTRLEGLPWMDQLTMDRILSDGIASP